MKKILFSFLMVAFLTPTVLFTSCDEDENEPVPPTGGEGIYEGSDLNGEITEVISLDPTVAYKLTAPLFIKEGGELTIPAGTTIKANKGFDKYILVLQGGKINISGTADKPVTMTSGEASPAAEDWGGLIINGRAPLAGGGTATTEINADYEYGGSDAADNSGSITYLKLEYTGARNNADVEHNGLTLNGVGSGTKIENVYIPFGADDGVEFFGGSVSVKNLLVVNSDDDMFDMTYGWNGTLENCYGVWMPGFESTESDPSGVEADGNFDGKFPDHTGQSNFTIRNMTIDLNAENMNNVLKIRRGAKATIENALVKGDGTVKTTGFIVDMTDSKGNGDATSVISITNQLVNNPAVAIKEADKFPNVQIEAGNTGCATNLFAWTGYSFSAGGNVLAGDELKGEIVTAVSLDPSVAYKLTAPLFIEAGGELTIPAGTTIKADKGFDKYILVLQGGKININGTVEEPVTMTSGEATPAAEDWGGLIINGRAPLAGGGTATTEINADYEYGGSDAADNSGSITYLKLEYTGARNSADVEHNGLTLNGVGSGTKIENVYIPFGADDGVEFFGGSVSVKNLLVVNSDDDMFDMTYGWNGTLENCYGVWMPGFESTESDPSGVEADGNFDGKFPNHTGQSDFTIRNMTIDLNAENMNNVLKIRRGAKATIENALVKGNGTVKTSGAIVDMTDTKGNGSTASVISITNALTSTPAATATKFGTDLFPNVLVGSNNTGCATDIFNWTGYTIQ